ncbi:MAG: hypothetical protein ACO20P_14095 [bacterium]
MERSPQAENHFLEGQTPNPRLVWIGWNLDAMRPIQLGHCRVAVSLGLR